MTPENQTRKKENQLVINALDTAKEIRSIMLSHNIQPSGLISALPFLLAEIFYHSEVTEQFKTEFFESLPKSVEFVLQVHKEAIERQNHAN